MISFEAGLKVILEKTPRLGSTHLPLKRLAGSRLAEDIRAPFPLPAFDNSAMDGYAICAKDFKAAQAARPLSLTVVGTIRAGEASGALLPSGKAMRIMTGAPVPAGSDAVFMREEVEVDGGLFAKRSIKPGTNIRRRGEECMEGTLLLHRGAVVTPPVVGMLATLGYDSVPAYRMPRTTVIVTGDELVPPGQQTAVGQIYDSNGPMLLQTLQDGGIRSVKVFRSPDDPEHLRSLLETALRRSDLVITVGGISVGDYDHVRVAAGSSGAVEHFWGLAIKPGKPLYFATFPRGKRKPAVLFGLPGNAVSALLCCEIFVMTAIRQMTGDSSPSPKMAQARLATDVPNASNRTELICAKIENRDGVLIAHPVDQQGPHMVSGLTEADGIIITPLAAAALPAGSLVKIIFPQFQRRRV